MIAAGEAHTIFVDANGLVWTSGLNNEGQLGLGHFQLQNTFTQVLNVPCAVQVSAAEYGSHSAILDEHGDVWMCGKNNWLLSDSNEYDMRTMKQTIPSKIPNLPKITMMSCGGNHSIVLDVTGCIWGEGDNDEGQLSSEAGRIKKFTKIDSRKIGKISKICCGYSHTIVQSDTEELWGTGLNYDGQLGMGHNNNVARFQKITTEIGINDVAHFECRNLHTILLARDGGVWATGFGTDGVLGSGDTRSVNKLTKILNIPPMVNIVCGSSSTIMTDVDGKVYACGRNFGQLGILGGDDIILSPQIVPDLASITQGCMLHIFTLLIDDEGRIWACGDNRFGNLGIGGNASITKFVLVEGHRANLGLLRFRNTKRAQ